jgi:hypothetical protein
VKPRSDLFRTYAVVFVALVSEGRRRQMKLRFFSLALVMVLTSMFSLGSAIASAAEWSLGTWGGNLTGSFPGLFPTEIEIKKIEPAGDISNVDLVYRWERNPALPAATSGSQDVKGTIKGNVLEFMWYWVNRPFPGYSQTPFMIMTYYTVTLKDDGGLDLKAKGWAFMYGTLKKQ